MAWTDAARAAALEARRRASRNYSKMQRQGYSAIGTIRQGPDALRQLYYEMQSRNRGDAFMAKAKALETKGVGGKGKGGFSKSGRKYIIARLRAMRGAPQSRAIKLGAAYRAAAETFAGK